MRESEWEREGVRERKGVRERGDLLIIREGTWWISKEAQGDVPRLMLLGF